MWCSNCGNISYSETMPLYTIAGHEIKAARYKIAIDICKEKYPWDYLEYKTLCKLYFSNDKIARSRWPKLHDYLFTNLRRT